MKRILTYKEKLNEFVSEQEEEINKVLDSRKGGKLSDEDISKLKKLSGQKEEEIEIPEDLYKTIVGFITNYDQNFDEFKWKDSERIRQRLDQAIQIIDLGLRKNRKDLLLITVECESNLIRKTAEEEKIDTKGLTIEKLESDLAEILSIENFDECTEALKKYNAEYSFVRSHSPFDKIYEKYVRLWHKRFLGNGSMEEDV